MPEVQAPPPLPKLQPFFGRRHSTILKLLGVGALVLVLLIPLAMITGVLVSDCNGGMRPLPISLRHGAENKM